jgi:hypothetical protein
MNFWGALRAPETNRLLSFPAELQRDSMKSNTTKLISFLRDAYISPKAFVFSSSQVDPLGLFSKNRLVDLLNNPLLTPEWLQVVSDGKALNFEKNFIWKSVQGKQLKFLDKRPLIEALRNKASLVLEGLDILDPELGMLVSEIDQLFPCVLSHCEAFWSRGGSNGSEAYGAHRDRDDVLAIQIEGQKRWRIYGQQQRRFSGNSPLLESELGPLIADLLMSPGDILYVKAGTPHWCTTPNDFSLHLSIDLNDQTPNVDQISQAANKLYFRGTAPAHSSPEEVIEAYRRTLEDSSLVEEMRKVKEAFRGQAKRFRSAVHGAHVLESPW